MRTATRILRRLVAAAGQRCRPAVVETGLGFGLGSLILRGLNAVADVIRNRVGKFRLKRCRLVLALFFGLLFAPLRTVAHPSAHVALVTRLMGRRQRQAEATAG